MGTVVLPSNIRNRCDSLINIKNNIRVIHRSGINYWHEMLKETTNHSLLKLIAACSKDKRRCLNVEGYAKIQREIIIIMVISHRKIPLFKLPTQRSKAQVLSTPNKRTKEIKPQLFSIYNRCSMMVAQLKVQ